MAYCQVCKGLGWFIANCDIEELGYKYTCYFDCSCENATGSNRPYGNYHTFKKFYHRELVTVKWDYADKPEEYSETKLSHEKRREALAQLKDLLK